MLSARMKFNAVQVCEVDDTDEGVVLATFADTAAFAMIMDLPTADPVGWFNGTQRTKAQIKRVVAAKKED